MLEKRVRQSPFIQSHYNHRRFINVSSGTPFHSVWNLLMCAAKADLDVLVIWQSFSGHRYAGASTQWISIKCFLRVVWFFKIDDRRPVKGSSELVQRRQRNAPSLVGTVFSSMRVFSPKSLPSFSLLVFNNFVVFSSKNFRSITLLSVSSRSQMLFKSRMENGDRDYRGKCLDLWEELSTSRLNSTSIDGISQQSRLSTHHHKYIFVTLEFNVLSKDIYILFTIFLTI